MDRNFSKDKKTILLTGSNGFIGSYFANHLQNDYNLILPVRNSTNYKYIICDLNYKEDVKSLEQCQPDIIIHCAANPRTSYYEDTHKDCMSNLQSTINLLEVFKNVHFINISSILVYNDYATKTVGPKTVYGVSKYGGELLANAYADINNIQVTNLRIPATVGPNLNKGVVFDVINKVLASNHIKLFGKEPGSSKPFLYIHELYKAIISIIDKKKYGTFDISPDDNISVKDIANIVMELFSKKVNIEWSGDSWVGDDQYILLKPNIRVETSSKEAITLGIKDYMREKKWINIL